MAGAPWRQKPPRLCKATASAASDLLECRQCSHDKQRKAPEARHSLNRSISDERDGQLSSSYKRHRCFATIRWWTFICTRAFQRDPFDDQVTLQKLADMGLRRVVWDSRALTVKCWNGAGFPPVPFDALCSGIGMAAEGGCRSFGILRFRSPY